MAHPLAAGDRTSNILVCLSIVRVYWYVLVLDTLTVRKSHFLSPAIRVHDSYVFLRRPGSLSHRHRGVIPGDRHIHILGMELSERNS